MLDQRCEAPAGVFVGDAARAPGAASFILSGPRDFRRRASCGTTTAWMSSITDCSAPTVDT
jgi:hypothetical protein